MKRRQSADISQRAQNLGFATPPVLCAAALTTGTHHLASPCGVRASLAENQPFRDVIPG